MTADSKSSKTPCPDNVVRGRFGTAAAANRKRVIALFDALIDWLDDRDDDRLRAALHGPAGELKPFPPKLPA